MTKKASDLETAPLFLGRAQPDPPVSVAMDHLVIESGDKLEEMARVSSQLMVNALSIGYIYTNIYGSKYVAGRVNQLLRVSISKDGQGRRDIIDVVDAGGNLPEGYYNPNDRRTFSALSGPPEVD